MAQIIPPTGEINSSWNNINFAYGWNNYGPPFLDAQWKRIGDIIFLKGLVRRYVGSSSVIGYLPEDIWPVKVAIMATLSGDNLGRLEIRANGEMIYVIGAGDWMALDGIFYPLTET